MKNLDKKQFNGLNILVLGDIILDQSIFFLYTFRPV